MSSAFLARPESDWLASNSLAFAIPGDGQILESHWALGPNRPGVMTAEPIEQFFGRDAWRSAVIAVPPGLWLPPDARGIPASGAR